MLEQSYLPFDDGSTLVAERSMLDKLLSDARLYHGSQEYKNLLDFVVRLRNFAPFNAMLLQIQKPGLMYAASARDWRERFDRWPKEDARPLIILWPFGPVALVYDVQDTEGKELPDGVNAFQASGSISATRMDGFLQLLGKKGIQTLWIDAGDGKAGSISVKQRASDAKQMSVYTLKINKSHSAAVQFSTLAHELAHLCMGHLGSDRYLSIPERSVPWHEQREIEAESVAYLVCKRSGVSPNSQTYLADFVQANDLVDKLDLYQVMRAAGQIETWLGLVAHSRFD